MSSTSSSPEVLRSRLLWESSSDELPSSSEEDIQNQVVRLRAPRNFRIRLDHFSRWSDEEFKMRFRLSKQTVGLLEQRIGEDIAPKTGRNHAVTAMQQILLVLQFCATGCMLQTIGDFAGIHKSTASHIVHKVINKISSLAPEYINMPDTQLEVDHVKRSFYRIAKFPRVIGAIDCTHIKIISPGGPNAEYFRNRKGYFSLNVQVVGDSDLYIRDIVARWPGSTHDQTIFNNSLLKARFDSNEFGNSILLGDSGYGLNKYLITPILNPINEVDQLFNESQIRSRNPIERLFDVLKRRFPILSLGIRLSLNHAKSIIIACAVLHNMARSRNEPEPINDPFVQIEDEQNEVEAVIPNGQGEPQNYREEFLLYFLNLLEQDRN